MCHGGWVPEAVLIERVLSLRHKIYRAFYTYTVLFRDRSQRLLPNEARV